ncbi:hypothetical protein DSTSK_22710 [Desulforhabdus sp. TSK]|nr:hypothetical protein DSTSK_22710 [Desulforhabdus sp. TSK]
MLFAGAASSRDTSQSRLEAAPTKTKIFTLNNYNSTTLPSSGGILEGTHGVSHFPGHLGVV